MRTVTFSLFCTVLIAVFPSLSTPEDFTIVLDSPKGVITLSNATVPLLRITDDVWRKRAELGVADDAIRCTAHTIAEPRRTLNGIELQTVVIASPKDEKPHRSDVLLVLWDAGGKTPRDNWVAKRTPSMSVVVVAFPERIPLISSAAILSAQEAHELDRCILEHTPAHSSPIFRPQGRRVA